MDVTDQYVETKDGLPYLILSYANGPGVWVNETTGGRRNVSGDDFDAFNYSVPAPVPRNSETHGGDDVHNLLIILKQTVNNYYICS